MDFVEDGGVGKGRDGGREDIADGEGIEMEVLGIEKSGAGIAVELGREDVETELRE